ncbi:MAG: helix-turn-helix transcriptional regulator [Bacillaceae bacterium]|nr:helix-turn-helix transcriptional regulator [Bacillaceae bacterium]
MKHIPVRVDVGPASFASYATQFHALADEKRLHIMYTLCQSGKISVGELCDIVGMAQSRLSYHLKILLDAGLILRETKGTSSYYTLNVKEVNHLLSEELCCIFRPSHCGTGSCATEN